MEAAYEPKRRALLIGTARYRDPQRFPNLPCTAADTAHLKHVLEHDRVGAYKLPVTIAMDLSANEMCQRITEFLDDLGPDDMGLLYISGHGVRLRPTGEFFFVASDTEPDRIEQTGVGASFVNDRLELCRAPQKIAILDCCYSGGFSLGFRTRHAKAAVAPTPSTSPLACPPLTSCGVYVIASSNVDEKSFVGESTNGNQAPSAFTGVLIDALRSGHGDKNSDGLIAIDELFEHVSEQMKKLPKLQQPVKASNGVTGRIVVARRMVGPPLAPPPMPVRLPSTTTLDDEPSKQATQPSWPTLIKYYTSCIEASQTELPLLSAEDRNTGYVCISGAERLLSGDVDQDGGVPEPDEVQELVVRAERESAVLWYGYPVVVLFEDRFRKPYPSPRLAPLLVRRIDAVDGTLCPCGEATIHRGLAKAVLGEKDAAALLSGFRPGWHGRMRADLARQVAELLMDKLEVPPLLELDPEDLAAELDLRTPLSGARNAAILFLDRSPQEARAQKKLLEDLGRLPVSAISETALGGLRLDARDADGAPATSVCDRTIPEHKTVQPCTPLPMNDGQQAVLEAAMTRRLTVATGPPGTGKSQLVANVMATCLAAGQRVLLASTNNRAVDEVWCRCKKIAPGAVIRTGSAGGEHDNRERERSSLERLANGEEARTDRATAAARLALARRTWTEVRAEMEAKARCESDLLSAAQARKTAAATFTDLIGGHAEALKCTLQQADMKRLARRAARVSRTKFLGRLRRWWLLRGLGVVGDRRSAELCTAIAQWTDAEQRCRLHGRVLAATVPDDEHQIAVSKAQADLCNCSADLLRAVVAQAGQTGEAAITALLQRDGADWWELRDVLKHVRGWAVTNQSVRRFPLDPGLFDLAIVDEASQCTIPQVLPVLFRAKRALIIGDPMQLQPVSGLTPAQEATVRRASGLSADYLECLRLSYHRHSAFHAVQHQVGESLWLDEHFRCHPEIAQVANEAFYAGRLTVLTDPSQQRSMDASAIMWISVAGACRRLSEGWANVPELNKVDQVVQRLLVRLPGDATIGIVTPFRGQAKLAKERWAHCERVRVGTIHVFQGGERDVMVFSPVVAQGMSGSARAWLGSQRNLWNVAITRARAHLIVVGDHTQWTDGLGAVLARAAKQSGKPPETDDAADDLGTMLYGRLVELHPDARLDQPVNGYVADGVVPGDDGPLIVSLDRGCHEDDPARHLHLQYQRLGLLSAGGQHRVVRVPAFQLYTDEPLWDPERATGTPPGS